MSSIPSGKVLAVHRSDQHAFSKREEAAIELVAGLGVAGDCHQGARVQHRSRVAADPTLPNLRQVHLLQCEFFVEAGGAGFDVQPGDLGENITTAGIDLLSLPTGAVLRFGDGPLIGLTGLRNPCKQIDEFQKGLLDVVLQRSEDGSLDRRAGVMAVVLCGGQVRPGDPIAVSLPPGLARPLARV